MCSSASIGSGYYSRRCGLIDGVVKAYRVPQTRETQDDLSRLVQASEDGHIRTDYSLEQTILCEDMNIDVNTTELILASIKFFFLDLTNVSNAGMGNFCFNALDECGFVVIMLFKIDRFVERKKLSLVLDTKRQLWPGSGYPNLDDIQAEFRENGLGQSGIDDERKFKFMADFFKENLKPHQEYTIANVIIQVRRDAIYHIRKAVPKTRLVQLIGSGAIYDWGEVFWGGEFHSKPVPVKAALFSTNRLNGLVQPYNEVTNHEACDLMDAAIHHFYSGVTDCRLAFGSEYLAGYCCWYVTFEDRDPCLQFFEVSISNTEPWKCSTAGQVSLGDVTTEILLKKLILLNGYVKRWNYYKWFEWNKTISELAEALVKVTDINAAEVKEVQVTCLKADGSKEHAKRLFVMDPFIRMVEKNGGILYELPLQYDPAREYTMCNTMQKSGCDKNSLAITAISHFFPECNFSSIRKAFSSDDTPGIIQAIYRDTITWLFVFSYDDVGGDPAVFRMNLCKRITLGDSTLENVRSRIADKMRISEMMSVQGAAGQIFARQSVQRTVGQIFARQLISAMKDIDDEKKSQYSIGERLHRNGVDEMFVPLLLSCENGGVAEFHRTFMQVTEFVELVLKGNGRLSNNDMLPLCDNVDGSVVDKKALMGAAVSHMVSNTTDVRLAFGKRRPLGENCYIARLENGNRKLIFFRVYSPPSMAPRFSLFITCGMEMKDGNMESLWNKFQSENDMSEWDSNMFADQLRKKLSDFK